MASIEKSLTSEKRKYQRFNVDLPIKCSGTALSPKQGRAINACEGGLLIHLPEEVEVGQDLALQLFFPPHSELDTLQTLVQVVWKRIQMRNDWGWDYRSGVKFVDISPENRTKFKNFLMTLV
jgi:c-di-GMP-binding flagellar brake protein YcgR